LRCAFPDDDVVHPTPTRYFGELVALSIDDLLPARAYPSAARIDRYLLTGLGVHERHEPGTG
jgi:hypothetical protein